MKEDDLYCEQCLTFTTSLRSLPEDIEPGGWALCPACYARATKGYGKSPKGPTAEMLFNAIKYGKVSGS